MAETPWRQVFTSNPPHPPPIGAEGSIPVTKLKTEISDRRIEPPICVQNAMLTKDKKPFTYTPGGLDLSEIRSPRMARRLERNAMSEGVSPSAHSQNYRESRPLPPSALAAMQPQLPVQVFPAGKVPQLNHNNHVGPPPPPPPPNNIPRPPPINLNAPLPVDSFDRPDMTKIIPDNPMALLRKTQGPVVKQDPIFNRQNYRDNKSNDNLVDSVPQNRIKKPEFSSLDAIDDEKIRNAGVGAIYVPRLNQDNSPPPSQFLRSNVQQISKREQENEARDTRPSHRYEGHTVTRAEPSQKEFCRQRSVNSPQSPQELLSKTPSPWMTQKRVQQDVPEWATNEKAHISPSDDRVTESKQHVQVPQLPTNSNRQPQLESHDWRQNQPAQYSRPEATSQTSIGGQRQIRLDEGISRPCGSEKVEVVIVNDPPPVFYHTGQPQYNSKSHNARLQQDNSTNVRIVPIQIELSLENGNASRNNENESNLRGFNRQHSWNSQPTQSNTFKVLQKITQTDGDDDQNLPIREHSPKSTNKFPQRQLSRENASNFSTPFNSCSRNEPLKRGPQIRTIPIRLEDDSSNRFYVPPSEQTVEEPKKYTGGSIPSRSFRILQAMTSPEELASANDEFESNESYSNNPTPNSEWDFDSNYSLPPYYYNPYWDPYSRDYFGIDDEQMREKYLSGIVRHENIATESGAPADRIKHRLTPIPARPACHYSNQNKRQCRRNRKAPNLPQIYGQFPPYWDPNAYGYYYGMLPSAYPIYARQNFYPPAIGDNEGYSSTDEMSYYGTRFASLSSFHNARPSVIEDKSSLTNKTKELNLSSENSKKYQKFLEEDSSVGETSDSDSEMTGYEVCKNPIGLGAISSVPSMDVYEENETSCCSDEEYDNSEENDTLSINSNDEAIPHQLSVIYEESEQVLDNEVRFLREGSVVTTISEDTETVENSESEEETKIIGTVSVKLPSELNFLVDDFKKVAAIVADDSEVSEPIFKKSVKQSSKGSEVTRNDDNSDVDWWEQLKEDDSCEKDKEESALNLDDNNYQIESESGDSIACSNSISKDLYLYEENQHDVNIVENSKERQQCLTSRWDEGEIDFWAEIINTDDGKGTEQNKNETAEFDDSNSIGSRISSSSSGTSSQNSELIVHDKEQKVTTESVYDSTSNNTENDRQLEVLRSRNFQEMEIKVKVGDRVSAIEDSFGPKNFTKLTPRKSSVKSQEDFSEEDYDSGVTSDVSKHISEVDNESDSTETKELYRYRRAATHSRLFKLLQEECDNEDSDEDGDKEATLNRRETLNLPLKKNNTSETESFSSSGFNSPSSPTINKKFLSDLMQSLLQTDPSVFKNMTLEKIRAAAIRILQEDAEENFGSTEDGGGILSRKNNYCHTESSTPARTPQEFYSNFNDYNQYYDSWAEASKESESQSEILPSKAFRSIQAQAAHNKTGAVTGLSARCPRVSSYKNVQKEVTRPIESRKSPTGLVDFDEAKSGP